MKIPLKYSLRSLGTRKLTTGLTMLGVALVVFAFAAVLMMASGLQRAMVETGSDDNVIALRKSANAEITSIIDRDQASIFESLPQVAKGPDGHPLVSKEVVVIINVPYIDKEGFANVTVRGISPAAFALRPQVHMVSGRPFRYGSREIIVGSSVEKRFKGARIGESMKFGGDQWTIVGTFDTEGSGFDSEIWGDVEQLGQAFERSVFSSITIRLASPDLLPAFLDNLKSDNRLQTLDVKKEKQFYSEQSELMVTFIDVVGLIITIGFSLGAVVGAMITMYAAVANRTVEIGTMRALGFPRGSVLSAFLVESILLALLGGIGGLLLASILQFYTVSMINFGTFSEIAFSFSLTPLTIAIALTFSVVMGIVGGFLPAVRASRMGITSALRAS